MAWRGLTVAVVVELLHTLPPQYEISPAVYHSQLDKIADTFQLYAPDPKSLSRASAKDGTDILIPSNRCTPP